ncbi:DDE superfamily endonuclease, CENP-B-like [Plasmopara halstedii]|uniref:DDE superfamily endonuclease, CENP-B-like n=1 Tax=Plasmopara halstedii TaxID=4781 RepID=A0A0P1B007_PLAHL|nr:DDE superfamily endonuclease, CENP-B-like [Plasmopara halstedii]CEG47216.1 DDE superfamily endonuclease, CENP-B-like [Plasmopara halstedii]|eukprot:XP_024583585.1 DDE superfamily endonuclease, CENP-B-like [Plasmopara halstedii]
MTSLIQPLDVGKQNARYRRKLVRCLLDAMHAGVNRKLNVSEVVQFAIATWEEVPAQVLRNCWLPCNIVDASTMARLRQKNDYGLVSDASVEEDLAGLMKDMYVTDGVDAYIDADSAEPVEWAPRM